jgi:hypothetical protein
MCLVFASRLQASLGWRVAAYAAFEAKLVRRRQHSSVKHAWIMRKKAPNIQSPVPAETNFEYGIKKWSTRPTQYAYGL